MGKKLAIGCGIVFLVLFVAGAGVAWWFIGRPAGQLIGSVRDVQRIERLQDDVRNTRAYVPPSDGVLAEAQLDRWLAVQEAMRADLQGRVDELEARYREIDERAGDPTPTEIARAAADVMGLLADATRAQVEALNEQGFSLDEYRWVRTRVLEAAGYAAANVNVAQIAQAAAAGEGGPAPSAADGDAVPPRNVELVAPYRERIENDLVFALFGL